MEDGQQAQRLLEEATKHSPGPQQRQNWTDLHLPQGERTGGADCPILASCAIEGGTGYYASAGHTSYLFTMDSGLNSL